MREPATLEEMQEHLLDEHDDDPRLRFAEYLTHEGCVVAHTITHVEQDWPHDHLRYDRP